MTFDALVSAYDDDCSKSPIARHLRQRVHTRLDVRFKRHDSILELGCDTGEAALHLAQREIHVTATDSRAPMLVITAAKTGSTGLVSTKHLDLSDLPAVTPVYDGVFSSLGALNLLKKWKPFARWLKDRVKPGGIAAFGVMNRLCLCEIFWYSLHGDFQTAFRRQRGEVAVNSPLAVSPIPLYYPTIKELEQAFQPYFKRIHVEPLGLFLPPRELYGVIDKRERVLNLMLSLDNRFGQLPAFATLADYYWIEFQRQ